jgi:hypothetical protein
MVTSYKYKKIKNKSSFIVFVEWVNITTNYMSNPDYRHMAKDENMVIMC